MAAQRAIGSVSWFDLTVKNAEEVRDFYQEVVGFVSKPEHMGEYSDFTMILPDSGKPVAGVCHCAGPNADLPPVWLVYFNVGGIDVSIEACVRRGGSVISGTRDLGSGKMCVIRDPSGACCALWCAKKSEGGTIEPAG